jgi:hypothetical protein
MEGRIQEGALSAKRTPVRPPAPTKLVPLSDETPEMVELSDGIPRGPLVTVLVVAIAICVLFIICAPIVKIVFFE